MKSRGANGFPILPLLTLIGPYSKSAYIGIVPVLVRQHVLPILSKIKFFDYGKIKLQMTLYEISPLNHFGTFQIIRRYIKQRFLHYLSLYQDRTYRVDFNPKKTELMTLKLDYISSFVAPVK